MSGQTSTAFIIAYPNDGSKLDSAIGGGSYQFDFELGTVTDPDGASSYMSTNLKKLGKETCKSVFIFVSSEDAVIKIGNTVLPQRQNIAYVLNQFHFTQMSISFPDNRTPNNVFGMQVIASVEDLFPLNIDNLSQQFSIPTISGSINNSALETLFDILTLGYGQVALITMNVDATNNLVVHVQYSEDGINWVDYQGYPATLTPGQNDQFATTVQHAYYRVYAEGSAAAATAYKIQSTLSK